MYVRVGEGGFLSWCVVYINMYVSVYVCHVYLLTQLCEIIDQL